MRYTMKIFTLALLLSVFALIGCEEKGPAEEAGQSVDNAVEETKDAMDPDGPVENAGEATDDKVDEMKENAEEMQDEATENK